MDASADALRSSVDGRILLESLIYTSEQMLVMADAGEWELMPHHQAQRDAVMGRLQTLRLSEWEISELRDLFERAQSLNETITAKVVMQRELARSKLMEIRRAETMQNGYGFATDPS